MDLRCPVYYPTITVKDHKYPVGKEDDNKKPVIKETHKGRPPCVSGILWLQKFSNAADIIIFWPTAYAFAQRRSAELPNTSKTTTSAFAEIVAFILEAKRAMRTPCKI